MIEETTENAARYGLSHLQLRIVNLIERGFNRASIAAELGTSADSVRNVIQGMSDIYSCPAKELPTRVSQAITLTGDGKGSVYGVLMDAHKYIEDENFDPDDAWVEDLLDRIEGAIRTVTVGSSRVKSDPNRGVSFLDRLKKENKIMRQGLGMISSTDPESDELATVISIAEAALLGAAPDLPARVLLATDPFEISAGSE